MDALGEKLMHDYMESTGRGDSLSADIEGFIVEGMGEKIVYEEFAEDDGFKVGFAADGKRELLVWQGDRKIGKAYDPYTIVISKELLRPCDSGRLRFTMAHEIAHKILLRHIPLQTVSYFCLSARDFYELSEAEMREIHYLNEACADRLAAALLTPEYMVKRVLERYNGGRPVICYDGAIFDQDEKLKIERMTNAMGVSFSEFINRLRELHLLDLHPFSEYRDILIRMKAG